MMLTYLKIKAYKYIIECIDQARNIVSQNNFKQNLGVLKGVNDIHPNVELRTPIKVSISGNCIIKKDVIINGRSSKSNYGVVLGVETYLKEGCYVDSYNGSVIFEGYNAIGQRCIIAGQGGVVIGKYTIMGANCYIISSNHNFKSKDYPILMQGDKIKDKSVVIGRNVWIGGGVIIIGKVTIGENSIIGAGSIITRDVPANTIYHNTRGNESVNNIKWQ